MFGNFGLVQDPEEKSKLMRILKKLSRQNPDFQLLENILKSIKVHQRNNDTGDTDGKYRFIQITEILHIVSRKRVRIYSISYNFLNNGQTLMIPIAKLSPISNVN